MTAVETDRHTRLLVGCRIHYVSDNDHHHVGFITAIGRYGEAPQVSLVVFTANGTTFWSSVSYSPFYEFGQGFHSGMSNAHTWHYLDEHERFVD